MVIINGQPVTVIPMDSPDPLQQNIFDILSKSTRRYEYASPEELVTELIARKSVVQASRDLAHSGFQFRVFRKSYANPAYWDRNMLGGFNLKSGVKPSDAIRDIFQNGQLYATECSTAVIIVYLGAMLGVVSEDQFNKLFPDIYLMNWEHIDRDLALREFDEIEDELPGDARYFINPDVDPVHPEWQGENVFYLGNGQYYGHGAGIDDAAGIIRKLNGLRKAGAQTPAYLLPGAKRQDYKQLTKYRLAAV
jgi:protein-glutamine gamma-glutamyltransferase